MLSTNDMFFNTWASHLWIVIHAMALQIDRVTRGRETFDHFMNNLDTLMTCDHCEKDYVAHLKEHPLEAVADADLFEWTVTLHNRVNARLNKPHLSVREARAIHEKKMSHLLR